MKFCTNVDLNAICISYIADDEDHLSYAHDLYGVADGRCFPSDMVVTIAENNVWYSVMMLTIDASENAASPEKYVNVINLEIKIEVSKNCTLVEKDRESIAASVRPLTHGN